MKTTLNKIRAQGPCYYGWRKLLTYLKKTEADDDPLPITTILDSNGIEDALWCLRAVEGHDREMRLYAVCCARQVKHLITDPRSLTALDVAKRHAHGMATDVELAAAFCEALDAARAAASVAPWDAARAAAEAVEASAGASASGAAWAAAGAAARAAMVAARDKGAAWEAAWDAARAAQSERLREVCAEIEYREKT